MRILALFLFLLGLSTGDTQAMKRLQIPKYLFGCGEICDRYEPVVYIKKRRTNKKVSLRLDSIHRVIMENVHTCVQ